MNNTSVNIFRDLAIILASVTIAVLLVHLGTIDWLLLTLKQFSLLGIVGAGMFFTSIFTTAPAIAVLGELSLSYHPALVAALGATGSIVGDLIIFRFVRDRFSEDLAALFQHRHPYERLRKLTHMKFFRWFSFFIGGLIIASPLPDELGISLLGVTKVKMSWFIPLAFVFNFLGILAIGLLARRLG